MAERPALWLLAAGFSGLGLGIGLVVGAYVARALRKFVRDEDLDGKE